MQVLLTVLFVIVLLLLFKYLYGYRKNHIIIDFDERYEDIQEHTQAIIAELESRKKEVKYQGTRRLLVDGSRYIITERTLNTGGVPMQRTILVPDKK